MHNAADIIEAIAPLRDGWLGKRSKAPPPSVSSDVAVALEGISFADEPEVEIDIDDGTVIVRWFKGDESFSLTFVGNGNVTGCHLGATPEPAWKLPVAEAQALIKETSFIR